MPRTERRWWEFPQAGELPAGLPTPECFTDEEWWAYHEAEKQATWNSKSVKKAIIKDMCEDCELPYQLSQLRIGKCNPHYGAITPVHRRALLAAGEEDPIEQESKSNSTPWSDLPLLSGQSAGYRENGAGPEEGASTEDDSLVLPE